MTVHARPRIRAVSTFAVLVMALGVTYACTDVRRQVGDVCLKNEDCATDICSQQKCIAAPPLLDGSLPPTGTDSGSDTGTGADAASDTGSDAHDSGADGPPGD